MTPTVDELREVGLRPNQSIKGGVPQFDTSDGWFYAEPMFGQRTLGEYWRRRRLLHDDMRTWGWSQALVRRILGENRWKAWPKLGWSRKGKGQR